MKLELVTKKMEPVVLHKQTGNQARKIREQKAISRNYLAQEMGISRKLLISLEQGIAIWTTDKVQAFNDAIERAR